MQLRGSAPLPPHCCRGLSRLLKLNTLADTWFKAPSSDSQRRAVRDVNIFGWIASWRRSYG